MTQLQQIVDYTNSYLQIDEFQDDSWNGLQFMGKASVKRIASAVDASIDSIAKATKQSADLLVVHHGTFWRPSNPSVIDWQKERLALLSKNDLSLYAVHLPLDKHQEVGNNAQLLNLLGASNLSDFYEAHGQSIGWQGKLPKSRSLSSIVKKIEQSLNTTCQVHSYGPKQIKTIAICSGGGSYQGFFAALNAKVDLYISGDPVYVEPTVKDAKANVIFAGHYATETIGVQALGDHLAKKFNLSHSFLDAT